jgi:hypothetical protein
MYLRDRIRNDEIRKRPHPTNCRPQVAVGRAHCEEERLLGRKGPPKATAYREKQRW